MAGSPSSILQLAAAIAVAATISIAPTAAPAETGATTGNSTAAAARIAPTRAGRSTAFYDGRHFRPIRRPLDCSGAWCGRQFVLMVGVAY